RRVVDISRGPSRSSSGACDSGGSSDSGSSSGSGHLCSSSGSGSSNGDSDSSACSGGSNVGSLGGSGGGVPSPSASAARSLPAERLYLGVAVAAEGRRGLFRAQRGLVLTMEDRLYDVPSCNGLLRGEVMLQALPSIVAAQPHAGHVLAPRPGSRVLDISCGKTQQASRSMGTKTPNRTSQSSNAHSHVLGSPSMRAAAPSSPSSPTSRSSSSRHSAASAVAHPAAALPQVDRSCASAYAASSSSHHCSASARRAQSASAVSADVAQLTSPGSSCATAGSSRKTTSDPSSASCPAAAIRDRLRRPQGGLQRRHVHGPQRP
ncbi:hypothetical protein TSOC_014137, partial [Tetrabaena socialis]